MRRADFFQVERSDAECRRTPAPDPARQAGAASPFGPGPSGRAAADVDTSRPGRRAVAQIGLDHTVVGRRDPAAAVEVTARVGPLAHVPSVRCSPPSSPAPHAADRAAIDNDTRVLITGQGVSGLIMTQVIARCRPAVLAVTDLFDGKLKLARSYGATRAYRVATTSTPTRQALGDAFPDGFDVVIPCVLSGDGVADAVDMAAQNGRVIMYGGLSPASRPVDYFRVHRRRLDIYSTEPKTDADMRRYFETASALVSAGDIRVADMITHRIGLDEIDRAFELKRKPSGDVIHVMIDCRG